MLLVNRACRGRTVSRPVQSLIGFMQRVGSGDLDAKAEFGGSGEFFAALEPLKQHRHVGDARGLGLLAGIEFVKDKNTKVPFPHEENIAGKIFQAAMEQGVLTYPTQGCVDGVNGDHILLAPPFIITSEECHIAARAIADAMKKIFPAP